MSAFLRQGLTTIRDAIKGVITHIGVTDDPAEFDALDTALNPDDGDVYIASATKTNVDFQTADYTFVVTSANFGDKDITAIGLLTGSDPSNAVSRSVRTRTLGIEAANEQMTITVRLQSQDATP